ncbi:MAG: hypothetical protein NVS4B2_33190 [Chloroflexota bacterium]
MTPQDILNGLRIQGARVRVQDGKLIVTPDKRRPLPTGLAALIGPNKQAIIAALEARGPAPLRDPETAAITMQRQRAEKADPVLWQMEQAGEMDTPRYSGYLAEFQTILARYKTECDMASRVPV